VACLAEDAPLLLRQVRMYIISICIIRVYNMSIIIIINQRIATAVGGSGVFG